MIIYFCFLNIDLTTKIKVFMDISTKTLRPFCQISSYSHKTVKKYSTYSLKYNIMSKGDLKYYFIF